MAGYTMEGCVYHRDSSITGDEESVDTFLNLEKTCVLQTTFSISNHLAAFTQEIPEGSWDPPWIDCYKILSVLFR